LQGVLSVQVEPLPFGAAYAEHAGWAYVVRGRSSRRRKARKVGIGGLLYG